MEARLFLTGRLTRDAENIINKFNKEQCLINLAVNVSENETLFFDCFINYHLSNETLEIYKKGILCTFNGKYNQFLQQGKDETYLKRVLNVTDFNPSRDKGKYSQNMKIVFVGYLIDDAEIVDNKTVLKVTETPLGEATENNKRFVATFNYKASNVKEMKENSLVYLFGYYSEKLSFSPSIGTTIERCIDLREYEILSVATPQKETRKIGDYMK